MFPAYLFFHTHIDFKFCNTQAYRRRCGTKNFFPLELCEDKLPMFHPPSNSFVFPTNQNILYNYKTVIKIRKQDISPISPSDATPIVPVDPVVVSVEEGPARKPWAHSVVSSVSDIQQSSQSLTFITLTVLKSTGQSFCRLFHIWGLSDVSS